jgi:hypothetical protein
VRYPATGGMSARERQRRRNLKYLRQRKATWQPERLCRNGCEFPDPIEIFAGEISSELAERAGIIPTQPVFYCTKCLNLSQGWFDKAMDPLPTRRLPLFLDPTSLTPFYKGAPPNTAI